VGTEAVEKETQTENQRAKNLQEHSRPLLPGNRQLQNQKSNPTQKETETDETARRCLDTSGNRLKPKTETALPARTKLKNADLTQL